MKALTSTTTTSAAQRSFVLPGSMSLSAGSFRRAYGNTVTRQLDLCGRLGHEAKIEQPGTWFRPPGVPLTL
jgi:hypothetical protein